MNKINKDNFIRIFLHIFSLIPLGYILYNFYYDAWDINPIQTLVLRTGRTTIFFLLLTLTITPLAYFSGYRKLTKHRRTIGLYSSFYVAIHFFSFIGIDYGFKFEYIIEEIAKKNYILLGFTAGLILLTLAITSTKSSQAKLKKGWKKLHKTAYLAAFLGVAHYTLAVKADLTIPIIYGIILAFVLLLRLQKVKKLKQGMLRKLKTPY